MTAHRQAKTQIKPEFLQKKNPNQTLSYPIQVFVGGTSASQIELFVGYNKIILALNLKI